MNKLLSQSFTRQQWTAVSTGAISVVLAIAYLLLARVLDSRELVPAVMDDSEDVNIMKSLR